MGLTTTESRLYIVNLTTFESIELQFVPPSIDINRNPNVEQVDIIGLNLPRTQQQGGPRTLDMELDFYAAEQDRKDVITKCRQLEALTYRDGPDIPAPQVRLVFGTMFYQEIWTVRKVEYSLTQFDRKYAYLPMRAKVRITLVQDGALEPTATSVKYY